MEPALDVVRLLMEGVPMGTKLFGGGSGGKPLQRLNDRGEVVWQKGDEKLVHRFVCSSRIARQIAFLEFLSLSLKPWVSEIVMRRRGRRGRQAC